MEEEKVEVNYDSLYNFPGYEVLEAKFNLMTTIQQKAFDKDKYKPEENIVLKNEKGQDEVKEIPQSLYIRWRNSKAKANTDSSTNGYSSKVDSILGVKNTNTDEDGNLIYTPESNARIVEWSDGSYQLIIGEEYYDIKFSEMDNIRLGVKEKDAFLVYKPVKKRIILTPCEYSNTVKKVEKVIDRGENSQKVKLAYNFYDKQEYRKEDFNTIFGKKKGGNKEKEKTFIGGRKRKRSNLSDR